MKATIMGKSITFHNMEIYSVISISIRNPPTQQVTLLNRQVRTNRYFTVGAFQKPDFESDFIIKTALRASVQIQ